MSIPKNLESGIATNPAFKDQARECSRSVLSIMEFPDLTPERISDAQMLIAGEFSKGGSPAETTAEIIAWYLADLDKSRQNSSSDPDVLKAKSEHDLMHETGLARSMRKTIIEKSLYKSMALMSADKNMAFHGPHHIMKDTLPAMLLMFMTAQAAGVALPDTDTLFAIFISNIWHDAIYTYTTPQNPGENERLSAVLALKETGGFVKTLTSDPIMEKRMFKPDIIEQSILNTIPSRRSEIAKSPEDPTTIMADADLFASLAQPTEDAQDRTDQFIEEMEEHGVDASKITLKNFFLYGAPTGFVSNIGKIFQPIYTQNRDAVCSQG